MQIELTRKISIISLKNKLHWRYICLNIFHISRRIKMTYFCCYRYCIINSTFARYWYMYNYFYRIIQINLQIKITRDIFRINLYWFFWNLDSIQLQEILFIFYCLICFFNSIINSNGLLLQFFDCPILNAEGRLWIWPTTFSRIAIKMSISLVCLCQANQAIRRLDCIAEIGTWLSWLCGRATNEPAW